MAAPCPHQRELQQQSNHRTAVQGSSVANLDPLYPPRLQGIRCQELAQQLPSEAHLSQCALHGKGHRRTGIFGVRRSLSSRGD